MLQIAGAVAPVYPPAGHSTWTTPDPAGGAESDWIPWPSWVGAEAGWSPDLSPDGSTAVFVSNRSGLPRAWAQPVDGWAPARSLPTGTDYILDVSWSPDGQWIACLGTPSGAATRTRIWLVAADGGRAHRVAGTPVGTAVFGPWLRSSAVLPVVSTGGRPSETKASLLDVMSGAARDVACGAPLTVVDLSHDGGRALVRRGPRGHRGLVTVDLATGRQQPLLVPDRPGEGCTEAGGFLPDGTIWARSDVGLLLAGLYTLPPDGAPHVLAARPNAELDTVTVTDDGQTAALVWNVLGHSEVELLNLASGERTPVELPAEVAVVDRARFSRNGRRLVLAASGPALPRGLWLLDRGLAASRGRGPKSRHAAKGPRRLTVPVRRVDRSSVPLPRPDLLVRPTLERLPADDGLELTGWLYQPPASTAPYPTVLWLHGGPEAQTRPTFFPLHQALVHAGIAVFAPNVRGSSGFGRTFERADNGARRIDAIRDVLACALHVLRSGVATPGRVGVMGHSYGGYLTLAALTFFPELFAAGVDVCGMSDLLTFFAHTEPWVAAAAATKYGDPIADADLLAELSPLRRFDRLRAPLLVVHGAHDRNVPVSESEQAVTAARQRGLPVDYLLFPDEGHDIERPANQLTFVDAALSWLTRHLHGPSIETYTELCCQDRQRSLAVPTRVGGCRQGAF